MSLRRMHPFRLAIYELNMLEGAAARELGITHTWLSRVLNDDPDAVPSRALYEDMVRVAKGRITMKQLLAHRMPGRNRRESSSANAA